MATPTAQACHALTTYFISKYEEVVGTRPVVNRNKSKAGAYGLLMDYTPSQARELVDYYIEHWDSPSIQWFWYNYDAVDTAKQEHETNEESARKRREVTQARLEEWRNRWKKS